MVRDRSFFDTPDHLFFALLLCAALPAFLPETLDSASVITVNELRLSRVFVNGNCVITPRNHMDLRLTEYFRAEFAGEHKKSVLLLEKVHGVFAYMFRVVFAATMQTITRSIVTHLCHSFISNGFFFRSNSRYNSRADSRTPRRIRIRRTHKRNFETLTSGKGATAKWRMPVARPARGS
jgi:hypothetical protein